MLQDSLKKRKNDSVATGLTIDDAEFLHAALGRLLKRFKNLF
jgi:hypothetical protein